MRLDVLDLSTAAARPSGLENGPRSIAAVRVLRISITDRCNYRCLYCMPQEGVRWLPAADILRFDEIVQIARAAVEIHGITRFKLTGGEPTVRPGLADLVAQLSAIPGVEDLSLTTNGQLLAELALPLRQAGLDRITVSIDSLKPEKFRRITRTGDLTAVLNGLDRAEAAGFASLKVNCVTMRGVNDDEFVDFARLSLDRRLTVRFIEYMPLGEAAILEHAGPAGPVSGCAGQDRGADSLVPEEEVRAAVERELGELIPVQRDQEAGVGPANVYRLAWGRPRGRIGFISAMSAPFCATCNRLRLTADGLLRSCLFEGGEVDVKPILRDSSLSGQAGAPKNPGGSTSGVKHSFFPSSGTPGEGQGGGLGPHQEQSRLLRATPPPLSSPGVPGEEVRVPGFLGTPGQAAALAQAMTDCVRLKPDVHSHHGNQQMSRIGG